MPDTLQVHKVGGLQIRSHREVGAYRSREARPPQIKATSDVSFHVSPTKRCHFITQLLTHGAERVGVPESQEAQDAATESALPEAQT